MPGRVGAAALLLGLGVSSYGLVDNTMSDGTQWRLVWEEEFDGDTLNATRWNVENQGGEKGNKEEEYYSPDMVSLDGDGHLVLKSLPSTDYPGWKYVSGRVNTMGKVNLGPQGRWEVTAILPYGQGMWPAHWLMPESDACWPMAGELDIMEQIDADETGAARVHGATHYSTVDCGPSNEISGGGWSPTFPTPAYDTQFHTFGTVWNSSSILFYVSGPGVGPEGSNGTSYYGVDDTIGPKYFNTSFYWILNTAVGGSWPGYPNATDQWPQYHTIDAARYYVPAE